MSGAARRAARLLQHKTIVSGMPDKRRRKPAATAKRAPTKREQAFDLSDEEIERRYQDEIAAIRRRRQR